jgi:GNAT superfamily N-acetyltransferase
MLKALRFRALADAPYAFADTLAAVRSAPDSRWQSRTARNSEGDGSTCVVAFDDREPVGMAACFFDDDRRACAHLVAMWVAEEYRGRHVAATLLRDIIDWARGAGAAGIDAGVSAGNVRARRFYEKHGFKEAGTRSIDAPHLGGCEHTMVLELDDKASESGGADAEDRAPHP